MMWNALSAPEQAQAAPLACGRELLAPARILCADHLHRVGQVKGVRSGLTATASTVSVALSVTRRLRNHVKKIIGKPCAGKPHARIERGMGKRTRTAGTAP